MAKEKRLIDANALKKEIVDFKVNLLLKNQDYGTGYFSALSVVEGMLAYAPTVDAVEVVRCVNCKHYEKCESSLIGEVWCCTGQGSARIQKNEADFCSYGERRKMREILFRGKRKDNGKWVYGSNIFIDGKFSYIYILNPSEDVRDLAYVCREVMPETVGQYTGLTDRNGKKIFEGDILKCTFAHHPFVAEVYFVNGGFCIKNKKIECMCLIEGNGFVHEVIGNIHDNPELLERSEA